ncbi:helix-turn-helix transcriptional regulator [Donghicola eburneus]|uniref:helix-turn-helix transcriptional regulator n=1 Tax=Donghicola eburneus TaxID=393278 RepID=UPI001C431099|nr:AlpA family phage regulatory protein [Donghicola eburneus]
MKTYLSAQQVAQRYSVHRTTPWRWVQNDKNFPKPIQFSEGCTRWALSEIEAWEEAKAQRSK